MNYYIIVETELGLVVADVPAGKSADEAAVGLNGVVVDPGPYESFQDAQDAMYALPADREERARFRD